MLNSLLLAIRVISRNRVRAGLTILGILIGVAALVAVTTLGLAVKEKVEDSMRDLAANAVAVFPETPPTGSKETIPKPLTDADARQIAREVLSADHVAPISQQTTQVIRGNLNETTWATGTTTEYFEVTKQEFSFGRPWTSVEESQRMRVCVLGSSLKDALFPDENPVGEIIRVANTPYRVVGALEESAGSAFGGDQNNVLLIPIASFRSRIKPTNRDRLDIIYISASTSSTDRVRKSVTSLLRQRHRIRPGTPLDFSVSPPSELEQLQLVFAGALSALLLCVASVSLLVGGIGVMNIMLVSVTERTREIGIRISIGATSKDILQQFLVEAIVLSSLGGVLGLILGVYGAKALQGVVDVQMNTKPSLAILAMLTSTAIGVFFGYLPARRAASLDPIQALRSDG